ncbi:MAG: hypothetical protein V2A79_14775 [Planctomycetota bacterium]
MPKPKLSDLAWRCLARMPLLPQGALVVEIAEDELLATDPKCERHRVCEAIAEIQAVLGKPLARVKVADGAYGYSLGWGVRLDRWRDVRTLARGWLAKAP